MKLIYCLVIGVLGLNYTSYGVTQAQNFNISFPYESYSKDTASYMASVNPGNRVILRESTMDYQVAVGEMLYFFGKDLGNLRLVKKGAKFIYLNQPFVIGDTLVRVQKVNWGRKNDGSVQIKSSLDTGEMLCWTVKPTGELKMEAFYHLSDDDRHPNIGFTYPEREIKSAQLIGNHPSSSEGYGLEKSQFVLWEFTQGHLDIESKTSSLDDLGFQGTSSDFQVLLLHTENASIEVRSETDNLHACFHIGEYQNDITLESQVVELANFTFSTMGTVEAQSNSQNGNSPKVSLQRNRSMEPASTVLWFRFTSAD